MTEIPTPALSRQQRRKAERSSVAERSAAVPEERWVPLRPSKLPSTHFEGCTHAYDNPIYRVIVCTAGQIHDSYVADHKPGWLHILIKRHDGLPVCNWHHMQRIKAEIAGPECEAVELFPAHSRVVDVANVYHLWVNPNPKFRFDLGFDCARNVDPERDYPAAVPLLAAP